MRKGEVQSEAIAEHGFLNTGIAATGSHYHVIINARFQCILVAENDATSRLEIEAAQIFVIVSETDLLALVISTNIKAEETGLPRGVEADTEVTGSRKRILESAMVRTIDVAVVETYFLNADREDQVGTRNDTGVGLFVC